MGNHYIWMPAEVAADGQSLECKKCNLEYKKCVDFVKENGFNYFCAFYLSSRLSNFDNDKEYLVRCIYSGNFE